MKNIEIILLRDRPELADGAARWFHEKWGIPEEAYRESIGASLTGTDPVPAWFLALDGDRIVGGLGVIENDFHPRRDLAPNVCAVNVEEDCRRRGIAGLLLARAEEEMAACLQNGGCARCRRQSPFPAPSGRNPARGRR